MRTICTILCCLLLATSSKAQQLRFASDIQTLTAKIEKTKNVRIKNIIHYRCDDNCNKHPFSSTSYFTDATGKQLLSVMVSNPEASDIRTYYFQNERLIKVKHCTDQEKGSFSRVSFFTDLVLQANIQEQETGAATNQPSHQQLFAEAYKLLILFKSFNL